MHDIFLQHLWPHGVPAGTYLLLWSRRPDPRAPDDAKRAQKTSYWCPDLAQANQLLRRMVPHRDADWYLGCGLSGMAYGAYARCKAPDIVALPGLWLDMDVADGGHKKKALPETQDQALEMLFSMPLPPSIVVHSGGGLQGWWLLDEPALLLRPGEAMHSERMVPHEEGAALSERWTKHLIALCGRRGWTADSTHDLARVMRLPGTWNVKLGTGDRARPTSILGLYGPDGVVADEPVRYSFETIQGALHGAEGVLRGELTCGGSEPGGAPGVRSSGEPGGHASGEAGRPGAGTQAPFSGGGGLDGERCADGFRRSGGGDSCAAAPGGDERVPGAAVGGDEQFTPDLRQIVDATLDNLCTIPRFEATWDRRRGFSDNSLSTYDGALALFCVNAEVDERVIAEIIRLFRLHHGKTTDEREKGTRADYIQRTIRTAHEVMARDEADRFERARLAAEQKLGKKVERATETALRKETAAAMKEQGLARPGRKAEKKRSSAIERLLLEYTEARAGGGGETQREALLGEICARLGADVEKLVCFQAEPSTYSLHVGGHEVKVGGIENLYSYHKLMLRVADSSGIFFPAKADGWDSIVRALHAIREVKSLGEDGTDAGFITECVEGYLKSLRILAGTNIARAIDKREPFVKDGLLYVTLTALRESSRDLQNLSPKAIAAILIQWGAQQKVVGYTRTEEDAIVKTTTRAYLLPRQEMWTRYIARRERSQEGADATAEEVAI